MKTLVTGASGFLGSYIIKEIITSVVTLGRGESNTIICDLAQEVPTLPPIDVVIHNAGLAHKIPKSSKEENRFFEVNLRGTENLIKALEKSSILPRSFIYISTVAVYGIESGEMVSESFQPNPQTPYARSKYETELLIRKWANHNNIKFVILRLPLVAGAKNTPGNLGAMIRAIQKGYYFRIGEGLSRKSIVLAEDIAHLVTKLENHQGTYNLTDGAHPSISELDSYIAIHFGRKIRSIPLKILQKISKIGDIIPGFPLNSYRLTKLNQTLTFDDSKAQLELGWHPRPVVGHLDF